MASNVELSRAADGGSGTIVYGRTDSPWQAGVVAPVFSDFAGREWEREYPCLLAQYYDTLAAFGSAGLWSDVSTGGGKDSVDGDRWLWRYERCVEPSDTRVETSGGSGQQRLFRRGNGLEFTRGVVGTPLETGSVGYDCGVVNEKEKKIKKKNDVGGIGGERVDAGCQGASAEVSDRYVLPQRRGPRGGVSVGRGKNYEKNQAARLRRKASRRNGGSSVGVSEASDVLGAKSVSSGAGARGFQAWRVGGGDGYGTFAACTQDQRDELQRTRAERLAAENKLKTAKALQELELVKARDIGQLKKRQETKLMRDTEVNKVQVERAFGTLAGTGNVPGFVQTVVSGESGSGSAPGLVSGSISPNSSVSMAEVHAMQKEILEMKRREEILAKESPELYAKVFAVKLESEKTGWTMDQEGNILGVHDGLGGYVGSDGRFHEGEDYDSW